MAAGVGIWNDKVTKWQIDEGEGVVGVGIRHHAHPLTDSRLPHLSNGSEIRRGRSVVSEID
jgi:hypothetical protein